MSPDGARDPRDDRVVAPRQGRQTVWTVLHPPPKIKRWTGWTVWLAEMAESTGLHGRELAPMSAPERTSPREAILTAAVRVILREGLLGLTLDAVAREAHVSKGGLLHHFASKDALVGGMISHFQAQQHAEIERRVKEQSGTEDGDEKVQRLRAYIDAAFPGGAEEAGFGQLSRSQLLALKLSLLAAVALNPRLLDGNRPQFCEWMMQSFQRPEDAETWITCLATDGLWLWELFGLIPLNPDVRQAIITRLQDRALHSDEPPAATTKSPHSPEASGS